MLVKILNLELNKVSIEKGMQKITSHFFSFIPSSYMIHIDCRCSLQAHSDWLSVSMWGWLPGNTNFNLNTTVEVRTFKHVENFSKSLIGPNWQHSKKRDLKCSGEQQFGSFFNIFWIKERTWMGCMKMKKSKAGIGL